MIKIKEIESAITKLPPRKFSTFRRWFEKLDAARWDQQFKDGVKKGRLDKHGQKALEDFKNGNCKAL